MKMLFSNVIFTVNNYSTDEYQKLISRDEFKYLVVGKEVGESGTPHLQGYAVLFKRSRANKVQEILGGRAFMEKRKGTHDQAVAYCKKDGDFVEKGEFNPGKRTDLSVAVETLKEHGIKAVAENHPEQFVKYSRGFRDLALALGESYDHTQTRGIWIHGPPGSGKSHAARGFSSDLYLKAQNKWFDGYNGERVILLDDLDTNVLGHYLKIWADKYSCTGETKGGTVHLRHTLFIITSNYCPDHFWPDDSMMVQAIERRFRLIEKNSRDDIIDSLIHD